jgi:hypothetical protein
MLPTKTESIERRDASAKARADLIEDMKALRKKEMSNATFNSLVAGMNALTSSVQTEINEMRVIEASRAVDLKFAASVRDLKEQRES